MQTEVHTQGNSSYPQNVVIATTIWRRHELTRKVLNYYSSLGMGLTLVACGSEGDSSKSLAEECGWHYTEYANQALSNKHNHLFSFCKQFSPSKIILIGSDDLLSGGLISYYVNNVNGSDLMLYGLKDLYFYNIKTTEAIRHKGFIGNKAMFSIGCGRCFTKATLEKLDYKPWGKSNMNRGLDITCSKILLEKGIPEVLIEMDDDRCAVDLKSEVNLTSMETFNFNYEKINNSIIFNKFALCQSL
jgi:hypothetical protein